MRALCQRAIPSTAAFDPVTLTKGEYCPIARLSSGAGRVDEAQAPSPLPRPAMTAAALRRSIATGQRSVALVSSSASKALPEYTSLPYRVISRRVSESNTWCPSLNLLAPGRLLPGKSWPIASEAAAARLSRSIASLAAASALAR